MPPTLVSAIGNRLQRIRVPMGFVFGALFVLFSRPTEVSLAGGLAVAITGLAVRVWSAGHLRKHQGLTQSGPYRWTRNPLYFGSFLLGGGLTLAAGTWWLPTLFLVLFLAIYLPVMKAEERELLAAYGAPYRDYSLQVPAFVPWKGALRGSNSGAFSWRRVLQNREYNAVLGAVLVTVILLLKVTGS